MSRKFLPQPLDSKGVLMGEYISGNYLDLGSDCVPELVLLRSKGNERWLDVWKWQVGYL